MRTTFDPPKRAITLAERGLDFEDAKKIFEGRVATARDDRKDYGEDRFISAGLLDGRLVVIVWTPRVSASGEAVRHIISMRKANEREQKKYQGQIGGDQI